MEEGREEEITAARERLIYGEGARGSKRNNSIYGDEV